MTLETRIRDMAIRIATEFNTTKGIRGALASLSTTDKSTFVAAINEVLSVANSAASIDDVNPSTTTVYSSSKVDSEISTAVANLVDSAPAALDTLAELATALQGNDTDISTIMTSLANRVRTDTAAQGLSAGDQANARTNIDAQEATAIGDTDRDFTADFTGGLT